MENRRKWHEFTFVEPLLKADEAEPYNEIELLYMLLMKLLSVED
jgi:hypothetical protein